MANWNILAPAAGVLSITQNGMFIVFSFNSGQYVRFYNPSELYGGVNSDVFWVYTSVKRENNRDNDFFTTELQFQIQAPQTPLQVAQDFSDQCLKAQRVSLGLTPT